MKKGYKKSEDYVCSVWTNATTCVQFKRTLVRSEVAIHGALSWAQRFVSQSLMAELLNRRRDSHKVNRFCHRRCLARPMIHSRPYWRASWLRLGIDHSNGINSHDNGLFEGQIYTPSISDDTIFSDPLVRDGSIQTTVHAKTKYDLVRSHLRDVPDIEPSQHSWARACLDCFIRMCKDQRMTPTKMA